MSKSDARSLYRSCLAHAVLCERRLWGSRFDLRQVMVYAAMAYRANYGRDE